MTVWLIQVFMVFMFRPMLLGLPLKANNALTADESTIFLIYISNNVNFIYVAFLVVLSN